LSHHERRRIVVLSDIHYPFTDTEKLLSIIKEELPELIIFLGDTVQNMKYADEFSQLIQEKSSCKNCVYIIGDNDISLQGEKFLRSIIGGKRFLFIHGFQFNLGSEQRTRKLAGALYRINKNLPILAFATISKLRSRSFRTYLILGHAHALRFFPHLKVACAGSLTSEENLYNDRGYLVIDQVDQHVTLTLKRIDGSSKDYHIS
jgi:uncharacterized protein